MIRRRIVIRGVVQGVGFRPFVHRLASNLGLSGYVVNLSDGVRIEIEGMACGASQFVSLLSLDAPPLAQIESIQVEEIAPLGETGFAIRHSEAEASRFGLVPPDTATCADCLRDFTDAANRRYRYAFTNCTNCGPRYSIIEDLPYDRPKTTMSEFRMCPLCQREYDDPGNRRFHAQPNACRDCGPALELWSAPGGPALDCADPLTAAQDLLRQGHILAIKGLGGFHLACDATHDAAVRTLRERKRRSGKAFALMVGSIEAAGRLCQVTPADCDALRNPARPIVILQRRPDAAVSPAVAPGNATLGVMLPYTPLHHLLLDGFAALVMTSANVSEEPIVSDNAELGKLGDLCDFYLVHNRRIRTRVDDSVVRTFEGRPTVIRRSRGFAPGTIALPGPVPELVACGGELKNTFCLTKDRHAILSQHIGDLANVETLAFFRETLEHMQRFYRVTPEAVAYDPHPGYLSTKFALELHGLERIAVQHHHAHIVSCMAENRITGKTIGVALDGTGFGTDGKMWGGEFLVCDELSFERAAHLRYVPLAGGDSAVRQPWRIALAYLRDAGCEVDLPCFHGASHGASFSVVKQMIAQRINTVDTSSCGRLFDAVSSLLGVCQVATYEGQAAVELEAMAAPGVEDSYGYEITGLEIDVRPMIRALIADLGAGAAIPLLSARFHNTVARMVAEVCARIRQAEHLNRVCLSGGTFQNHYLLQRSLQYLRLGGFDVHIHSTVPANDGGLALGQAVIAGARLMSGRKMP